MMGLSRRAGRHSAGAQSPAFAESGAVADLDRDAESWPGVDRSGCALSIFVAAAFMVVPVERMACSIFFSVVAKGSYETCRAPFSILVSITPSNAATASVIFFW